MAEYGINIGVNVQSSQLGRLTQQLKELRKIEQDLIELQKDGLVTQKDSNNLRRKAKDEISKNKKAALEAARSFSALTGVINKGSAALREQSAQFRAYRKGAKSAKDGWTTFTQAIVKSDFSAAFVDLKRLNKEAEATAKTFSLMAMGGGGGGPAFATGLSMQKLLEFKPANTTNALQAYSNVLEGVIRQVDRGSDQYKELAQRIREVNREMSQAITPTTQYQSPIGPEPAKRISLAERIRKSARFRDVATGAGFPLLFGGGPAQALAGGIGGAVGGLGGSIAASAIVSQIEAFGQAIAKVGQSLNPLTFDLQTFASAAGISGTEVEGFLATVERYGGKARAAAEASKILAMRIGTDARDALQKFGSDAQKLGNQLSTIFTTVMANIARIVGPLLSQLANALERGNLVRGFKEREGLTGRAAVAQQILGVTGGKGARNAEIKRLGAQIGLTGTTREILEGARGIGAETQRKFESQQFAGLGQTAAALEAAAKEKKPKKTEEEKEAERLMRQRQRFEEQQLKLQERQIELRDAELQKLEHQEVLLRARLAGNEEEVRYAIELGELQNKYGDEEGRRMADQKARIRASTEALREQQRVQGQINSLVNNAGQQFASLFETLINGTNDFNSALRNVLLSLSSSVFRYGLQAIGNAGDPAGQGIGLFSILSGTFGKRASGGSVSSGKPYMVGERGPELFVPGAQGNIVPNHGMGGSNIVVNVDATGSSVEGNAEDSKRLGEAIGVAIRQELIKQKRPGGLLA